MIRTCAVGLIGPLILSVLLVYELSATTGVKNVPIIYSLCRPVV